MPDTEASRARFPSKLSDYLMAGRPVVSSCVGEVAEYLRDGESALLSAPDDARAFADKMRRALDDPHRETIAQRGQAVARESFDYRVQGRRLEQFLSAVARARAS